MSDPKSGARSSSSVTGLAGLGDGVPLSVLKKARFLTSDELAASYGRALLLIHALDITGANRGGTRGLHDTGSGSANPAQPTAVVYPLRRKAESSFDFIAIGRHEKNDVCIPHASISRFHCFLRQMPEGFLLYDAQSSQGTYCNGVAAPKQGAVDAPLVKTGDTLRFGEVEAIFVSAAQLVDMLNKV